MSAKHPTPARRRGRFWPRTLLAVLVLGAAALALHALAWRWVGGQMETGLRAWAQAQRAGGWRVQYDTPVRGGWPLSATLTVPQFRIAGRAGALGGEFEWHMPRLELRVSAPLLDRVVAEPRGSQRLRFGTTEIPFAADRLEFVVPFEPGAAVRRMTIHAERVRAGTPEGPAELRALQAHLEARSSATDAEAALAVTLTSNGLDLPLGLLQNPSIAALGRRVEALALDGALSGPIPLSDSIADRAEAWREGGGTLEIREAMLGWGAVRGTLRMTLTLDESMQPMGAGQVQVSGAADLVRALVAAGVVAPRSGQAATLAIGLMARPPEGGGPPRLDLPVTLEDRRLAVGPIRLLRFAPIAWPAAPDNPAEVADPSLPASR